MTKTKSMILSLLITISINSFGQDCKCDKLLQDGLYSFTKMTKTESFSKDLRSYYLSETFKSDMRSGKWGSSLTIPIKGVPFSLGMNDSEEKFSELRTKLLEVTELSIDEGSVQTSFGSIPNTSLYEAFVECNRICYQNGSGFIQGKNLETEDAVVFTIYYKPSSPTDPMPIVTTFNVLPEGSVVNGNLIPNQQLTGFTTLITCKRPVDKDLILTLQTDRGGISSKAYAQESISSSKELPIGTIITSYLNFEQFNAATKNNEKSPGGIWTSTKSKWAPCDGRPVPNSKFQTLTSQVQIPDLRGMFLRGLNTFDPYQPVPVVSSSKADPDNRVVGTYQTDAFQGHFHDFSGNFVIANDGANPPSHITVSRPGVLVADKSYDYVKKPKSDGNNGTPRISEETIPKNVSVYYYIKIN
jgi:hypothetical protein